MLQFVEAYIVVAKLEHTLFYELTYYNHHHHHPLTHYLPLNLHLLTTLLQEATLVGFNDLEHIFVYS